MRDITSDFLCGALLRIPCKPETQTGMLFHKHQCPHCGETWAHLDVLPELVQGAGGRAMFEEAHTCGKCGTRQVLKLRDATEIAKAREAAMHDTALRGWLR